MFTDADFSLAFTPVSNDVALVLIPVSDEYGVIAVTKAYGSGKAACMAFAPAIKLGTQLDGFVPQYLRKIVTNDFALRTGQWKSVGLHPDNAEVLSDTIAPLMNDIESLPDEQIEIIDMQRPANRSSSVAVACKAFRAAEETPFEQALCHLLDITADVESQSRKS